MKTAIIICGYAVCVLAAAAGSAQSASYTSSGSCSKPDSEQHIAAGDRPDHVFSIAQGKCKAKNSLGGATSETAEFAEHREVTASSFKSWGTYVETYDSGDKIAYRFSMVLPIKAGAPQPGKGTFEATLGTGKLKGVKASGTCQYTPTADQGVDYTCTGEHSLPEASGAK